MALKGGLEGSGQEGLVFSPVGIFPPPELAHSQNQDSRIPGFPGLLRSTAGVTLLPAGDSVVSAWIGARKATPSPSPGHPKEIATYSRRERGLGVPPRDSTRSHTDPKGSLQMFLGVQAL